MKKEWFVLFNSARWLTILAGALTLYVTLLPGWTPFSDSYNELGLGGFTFIFIWPFIGLQIIVASLMNKKYAMKNPQKAWIILGVMMFIALQLDNLAISLAYFS